MAMLPPVLVEARDVCSLQVSRSSPLSLSLLGHRFIPLLRTYLSNTVVIESCTLVAGSCLPARIRLQIKQEIVHLPSVTRENIDGGRH